MREPGAFKVLSVTPVSPPKCLPNSKLTFPNCCNTTDCVVVGATTDYEVKLTAAIPIHDEDQLVIDFPAAIGTPGGEENFCEPPPQG